MLQFFFSNVLKSLGDGANLGEISPFCREIILNFLNLEDFNCIKCYYFSKCTRNVGGRDLSKLSPRKINAVNFEMFTLQQRLLILFKSTQIVDWMGLRRLPTGRTNIAAHSQNYCGCTIKGLNC